MVTQESATALAEMASSVAPEACETLCVRGIVTLSKDRVWAVRVAAAAAIPAIAAGTALESFELCSLPSPVLSVSQCWYYCRFDL